MKQGQSLKMTQWTEDTDLCYTLNRNKGPYLFSMKMFVHLLSHGVCLYIYTEETQKKITSSTISQQQQQQNSQQNLQCIPSISSLPPLPSLASRTSNLSNTSNSSNTSILSTNSTNSIVDDHDYDDNDIQIPRLSLDLLADYFEKKTYVLDTCSCDLCVSNRKNQRCMSLNYMLVH